MLVPYTLWEDLEEAPGSEQPSSSSHLESDPTEGRPLSLLNARVGVPGPTVWKGSEEPLLGVSQDGEAGDLGA